MLIIHLQNAASVIIDDFHKGHFHECFILYNFFKSVIAQGSKNRKIVTIR